jgi:hypothetical protein
LFWRKRSSNFRGKFCAIVARGIDVPVRRTVRRPASKAMACSCDHMTLTLADNKGRNSVKHDITILAAAAIIIKTKKRRRQCDGREGNNHGARRKSRNTDSVTEKA